MNGVLVKTWEVHCFKCENPALGIARFGSTNDAARELRKEWGWRTRDGKWHCADCCVPTRRSLEGDGK